MQILDYILFIDGISMEKWSVGKKNGVPQDVKFTYPIRFKLQ